MEMQCNNPELECDALGIKSRSKAELEEQRRGQTGGAVHDMEIQRTQSLSESEIKYCASRVPTEDESWRPQTFAITGSGSVPYRDCLLSDIDHKMLTSNTSDLQRDAMAGIEDRISRISTKKSFHDCLIEVDDELGDEDVANLKFLCRDFIPVAKLEKASRAIDIFEILENSGKIQVGNVDFVLECLIEMHRLDLVKKIGFDPNSVKEKAGQGSCLGPTPFRKLLFELAEDLSDDEVKRAKFFLKSEYLKRGNLQAIETAQELFILLEKEGKLSVENVQVLYDIFKTIKREELVRQVEQYHRPDRANTQTGLGPSRFQQVPYFPQTYGLNRTMSSNAPSNLQPNLGSQGRQDPGIVRSSSAGTIELEESEQPQHAVFSDNVLLQLAIAMKDIPYENVFEELGLSENEGIRFSTLNTAQRLYKLLKYWRDVKMKDSPGQVLPGLKYLCEKFDKIGCVKYLDTLAQDQQQTYELPTQDQGVQRSRQGALVPQAGYIQAGFQGQIGQMRSQQTWQQSQMPWVNYDKVALQQQWSVIPQSNTGQGGSQMQETVRTKDNVEQIRMQFQEPVVLQGNMGHVGSQAQQPVIPQGSSQPLPFPQGQGQTRPQQMTPSPSVRNVDLDADFPCYKMDARPRGICLIISNRNFTVAVEDADSKEMPARQGTEKDTDYLTQIFNKLHFTVIIKEDLKDFEMARALVDIAQNTDHSHYDCFVCCILSHGALGHVFGSNGKLIPIRDLTSCVQANRCHTLAGKPKLFFIQACQGREKQEGTDIEADSPNIPNDLEMDTGTKEMIPNEADFVLGYATVPGYVSFRSRTSGSWYIRKLVQMLEKYYDKTDLMTILVKVNEEVSKADANVDNGRYKQTPAPFVTLRKRLFFH
ncbi:hypothetical protein ACJMK2_013407 [Sinanodonta woodiana]|uniref:Caspase-8 n=1 Tax=Sinanodonta woodiana TaxID=1069815 RepID=A0ABD3UXE0_SINWO